MATCSAKRGPLERLTGRVRRSGCSDEGVKIADVAVAVAEDIYGA